jgi:hypothetical protein
MSDEEDGLQLIVQSINSILRSGLAVTVMREPGGAGASGGPGRRSGDAPSAVVTLVAGHGLAQRASQRLWLTSGRRSLLLALSACLAECAMDLGLGASVCSARRTETP